MGKLRTEPKVKSFLSQKEFDELLSVLKEAQKLSDENHVFWDLSPNEKSVTAKKGFAFVARKAGIDVTIRQVRGSHTIAFYFKKNKQGGSTRMSAAESRARILQCLKKGKKPLKKNQIIKETGISSSTWNIRIKELIKDGIVKRHGNRRDTTYTYPA